MAKILLSFYSNVSWTREKYKDSFIEGFINALQRMGEILNINISNNGKEGKIIDLDTESYLKGQDEKLKNFKYKIYYKIWKKLDRKLRKKGIIK